MKVLFLTRRFYPDIGGVERHVLEVSKELIKRGHEVTVITESSATQKARPAIGGVNNYHSGDQSDIYSINLDKAVRSIQTDTFKLRKIKVLRLNFGKENSLKKFRIWLRLLGHMGIIKQSNVIHCHDVFFWYFPFRFLFPLKKVFTTFHGFETKFPPSIKARLVRKISEKLSYGNICVGAFIKKWYGTKPDYVTYGGTKIQNSKFKIQNFNKKRKKLNILLVGRLEEDNGAKVYLEALKKLRKQGITYKLIVCGDGQFRKRFEKYGDAIGFTPNLNKYIDRSDFIFASSYLSILEAIIRGKNVFSVFQNELKKDYLVLSPFYNYVSIAGDASSLIEKVLYVRNNLNGTYNNIKKARNWSKRQTWSKVADIYLKLWKL